MTRVTFEGFTLDARTRDMIIAARVICKAPIVLTQGSYNGGGVAASAGTHDGGGAVDIRLRGLTASQCKEIEACLRKVGFAAWIREAIRGLWPKHAHGIAKGCPDLSRGARGQVTDYYAGRNGLANNGDDTGPRTWVNQTWEQYKQLYPHLLTEDVVLQSDIDKIVAAVKAELAPVTQAYSAFNAKNLTQQLATLLVNVESLDQKYAVAVNNYIKQLDTENDADAAALKAALAVVTGKVDAVAADVDKVEAAVTAPKA